MKMELTLSALERLIGGDTEIEISARNQIVQEFAKKHLKSLLNDEVFRSMSALWQVELRKEIPAALESLIEERRQQQITMHDSGMYDLRSKIQRVAEELVQAETERIVKGLKSHVSRTIDSAITKHIDETVKRRVEEGVQERLAKAASL